MNIFQRIPMVFISILALGWLSVQLSLYERAGMAGILLPGLIFGLPFSLINFAGWRQAMRAGLLISLLATISIAIAFLLGFALGPEGAGAPGVQLGLLLGFSCAALLTIMMFAVYKLSWPSALLAVAVGTLLPAVAGFETAGQASVRPELFAYFWLAVMGGVYTWGLRQEPVNKA